MHCCTCCFCETMQVDSAWGPLLWPARLAMPIGALLLTLQGIPEIFRAFHKMGKERERWFVRALPVYLILLTWLVMAVFVPDLVPGGAWFTDLMNARPNLPKPTIGLIMLGAMLFVIFIGFPIAFTLIFLAFVFGIWGANFKLTTLLMTLNTNSTMLNDQLMAVPLFVLMGIVMESAGLMERLFASIQMIMSRVRGALFIAVLIVSTIFAAATGIVGASVTLLGIMAGATMSRSGYNVRLAAGTITAGGTLGILIPPSIMLIVMGPVLEVSTLDLFRGAFIPGALLASLYLIYTLLDMPGRPDRVPRLWSWYWWRIWGTDAIWWLGCFVGGHCFGLCRLSTPRYFAHRRTHRSAVPSLHDLRKLGRRWRAKENGKDFYFSDLWNEFFAGLMPPTILISFALGSILLGFATPAEAAAMGAFGSILLSIGYRKFSIPSFFDSLVKALEITVLIMFLVAASNFFGAAISGSSSGNGADLPFGLAVGVGANSLDRCSHFIADGSRTRRAWFGTL